MFPVKSSELREIKRQLLIEQNNTCPVSLRYLDDSKETVVDHKHKLFKDQELGVDGAGLIRGVLDFRINSWEGKIVNSYRRLGLHNFGLSMPEMLRRLADYLEHDTTNLIHPTEIPKVKKLGKRKFNKIAKIYKAENPNRKPLEYPKSGKPTKQIKELALKYDIQIGDEESEC